jgi:HSP20 family protein
MGSNLSRLIHGLFLPGAQTIRENLWQPAVDVYRTRDGWLLKFDLAGVEPEDIRLEIHGDQLTVHGRRRDCTLEEGCCHFSMEIAYSSFERTLTLPVALDRARISLQHHHGMLLVRIRTEGTSS